MKQPLFVLTTFYLILSAIGNPQSAFGQYPFRVPIIFKDTTASTYQPIQLFKDNDTLNAWIQREFIAGNFQNHSLRVRDYGNMSQTTFAGLRAMSKGNDSTYVFANANANGSFQVGGRRPKGGSPAVDWIYSTYDSTVFNVRGVRKAWIDTSGVNGAIQTQAGSSVNGAYLVDGSVIANKLVESAQAFSTDIVFSATDNNTVSWTSGTLKLAYVSYSIVSGNSGNMTGLVYIYWDLNSSPTTLLTTTNYATVVSDATLLMCVAKPSVSASAMAFYVPAVGVLGVTDINIQANSISAGMIQAGQINAAHINVAQLSAISADMGSLTAGEVEIGSSNKIWLNDAGDGALNIGGSTKASAPFRVTSTGALTATSATVRGSFRSGTGDTYVLASGDNLSFVYETDPAGSIVAGAQGMIFIVGNNLATVEAPVIQLVASNGVYIDGDIDIGGAITSATWGGVGYTTSAWGSQTTFSPENMYVWDDDLGVSVAVSYRNLTINGVTVKVVVVQE